MGRDDAYGISMGRTTHTGRIRVSPKPGITKRLSEKPGAEGVNKNRKWGNMILPSSQIVLNYRPQNEELEDSVVPAQEAEDVEKRIQQQLEDGEKAKDEVEVEIANLAPKKITYDLKRGIQDKLDKLERRTDKAIAELIRQRLKEGKQQDFFIAVNAGARAQQKSAFDSDED
ncbi:unnamed protein product, partial [Meganyctiphanes norvegica]